MGKAQELSALPEGMMENICIPFTGESIGNVFNWGILGRVDVDYSYVGVNNGEPITLTAGSSSPNFSNYPAPGSGLPDRYVTLLNNFPIRKLFLNTSLLN